MTFPEGNGLVGHENMQPRAEQNYGVKQAYENGGIKAGADRAFRLAYGVLSRRKAAEEGAARLARVLTALDLTALGVGSTLGVGVYVLAGDVAKNYAGPAVILSFLLAAVASVFAGFDCVATAGEEARRPQKTIPFAVVASLLVVFLAYCGVSSVLTLMMPYYMQDEKAPFPFVYDQLGWPWAKYAVSVGAICALCSRYERTQSAHKAADPLNLSVRAVLRQLVNADRAPAPTRLSAATVTALVTLYGLCYAEFGSRVPRAGSAYIYTYVTVGQLAAFVIAWNMILESLFGAASVARGLSLYIDLMAGRSMSAWFASFASLDASILAPYFDFFAFGIVLVLGADPSNWSIPESSVPPSYGVGGFFPFGVWGTLKGAAVKEPRRSIPQAILIVLLIVFLALFGAMFPLPRLLYAMASDGLFFHWFARVSEGRKSPVVGTLLPAAIIVLMCLIATLVTVHVERSLAPSLVLHAVVLVLFVVLMMQPRVDEDVPFKTPLVPLIPCLSIPVYLICVFCYKQLDGRNESAHTQKNGKPPVQIIIESPTPPGTITRTSNNGGNKELIVEKPVELQERVVRNVVEEEIIVQQAAVIENNEEKEANIIDLLDQVIQAEEDTYSAKEDAYGEMPMEKEDDVIVSTSPEFIPHRKSLSELSDAGSDASLGNQVLSKYDVIAQVHREDLPKVSEEDDQNENNQNEDENNKDQVQNEEDEQITAFNDSETTSQTDESGYSDTIDRTALTESVEEIKENVPYIPVPPPFDENYFKSPNFKKSYTISARPSKARSIDEEENKPRESIQSNGSQDDSNIKFGSDRQLHFMSKLNTIYQTKIADQEDEPSVIKPGRRSHSTGNVVENTDYDVNRERPPLFLELKKELLARDTTNLRTVNKEEKEVEESESEEEEVSMTREDLKSKLENIFATGGPKLLAKPRLMKSNPPTPEESYQTDTSSTESIARLPKMEKNDTLGRQRAKFGEVLNSFRLSLNKDDQVYGKGFKAFLHFVTYKQEWDAGTLGFPTALLAYMGLDSICCTNFVLYWNMDSAALAVTLKSSKDEPAVCSSCNAVINGRRVIQALGVSWHAKHFVCGGCKKELGGGGFMEQVKKAPAEPSSSGFVLSGDAVARVAHLEHSVRFLQEQHRLMLGGLHNEIEALRERNRDLQFQLIFNKESSPKNTSPASEENADNTEEENLKREVSRLEREAAAARGEARAAEARALQLQRLVDAQSDEHSSSAGAAAAQQPSQARNPRPHVTRRYCPTLMQLLAVWGTGTADASRRRLDCVVSTEERYEFSLYAIR
ncbi:hypothetical protein MSG28_010018 [Choristoneura fumiferana]|uniref:Uncharacterized protein n=1 Tax=Choristoneura fumiferana TaxID=7141 RepID=A0ACC0KJG4_CHOFU|nr:hypothetical protein MSG28_010018 [Choristoneura fumiferana]